MTTKTTTAAVAAAVARFAERLPERVIPALCEAAAEQQRALYDKWEDRFDALGGNDAVDYEPEDEDALHDLRHVRGHALYRNCPYADQDETIDGSGDPPFLFDDRTTAEAVARIVAETQGYDVSVCYDEWDVVDDTCIASEGVAVVYRDGSTL